MKIRQGFVSNSSSSSFTCDICRRTVSGWDLGLEEAQMYECKKGHTFCDSHEEIHITDEGMSWEDKWDELLKFYKGWKPELYETLNRVETEEVFNYYWLEKWDIYWEQSVLDMRGYLPEEFCPLCNFGTVSDSDLVAYYLRKSGKTRTEVAQQLKEKYGTFEEFKKSLS